MVMALLGVIIHSITGGSGSAAKNEMTLHHSSRCVKNALLSGKSHTSHLRGSIIAG